MIVATIFFPRVFFFDVISANFSVEMLNHILSKYMDVHLKKENKNQIKFSLLQSDADLYGFGCVILDHFSVQMIVHNVRM